MHFKYIQSSGQSHDGVEFKTDPTVMSIDADNHMVKSASAVPMPEDMQNFWDIYPKKNPDKFLYVRVNILGAGEYWGANLNGDYFPEEALKKYYTTFMHARLFLHHQNKDPKKSHGRVIYASYNDAPYAKRVEVIVAIDRHDPRIQDVIRKIEKGEAIKVSMGCRVPFDICSICRNMAATRAQYCEHLKKEMNALYPDGRRVMALNMDPVFFDVSVVTIPADPSSGGMEKVAGMDNISSSILGELNGMQEKYAQSEKVKDEDKEAEIEKTGPDDKEEPKPAKLPKDIEDKKEELRASGAEASDSDPDMPEDKLTRLADFPMKEIMATMTGMGMPLRKKEFTCIIIKKASGEGAAKLAYRSGVEVGDAQASSDKAFDVVRDFNPKIAQVLMSTAQDRSMFSNHINGREDRAKTASVSRLRNVIDYEKGASDYSAYKRDVGTVDGVKLAAALLMNPDIKARLMGEIRGAYFSKVASANNIFDECYLACECLKGAVECF